MTIFHAVLVLATFLCALVAGLLFAFAVVVMPGIRSMDDGGFIRAFQAIDRVIQNNPPLFVFVWVGSVLALITAAGLGMWDTERHRSPADHRRRASLPALCAVADCHHQHSPEQRDSEAGPGLDERDDAKTCAGGLRAAVEPVERNQDRLRQRGFPRIDAFTTERVTSPDANGGAYLNSRRAISP